MYIDNSKEYAYVKEKKYALAMDSSKYPFIKGDNSFMSIAANVLFTQVSEHAQMSAKAGIKCFSDIALAAMIGEYK